MAEQYGPGHAAATLSNGVNGKGKQAVKDVSHRYEALEEDEGGSEDVDGDVSAAMLQIDTEELFRSILLSWSSSLI